MADPPAREAGPLEQVQQRGVRTQARRGGVEAAQLEVGRRGVSPRTGSAARGPGRASSELAPSNSSRARPCDAERRPAPVTAATRSPSSPTSASRSQSGRGATPGSVNATNGLVVERIAGRASPSGARPAGPSPRRPPSRDRPPPVRRRPARRGRTARSRSRACRRWRPGATRPAPSRARVGGTLRGQPVAERGVPLALARDHIAPGDASRRPRVAAPGRRPSGPAAARPHPARPARTGSPRRRSWTRAPPSRSPRA